MIRLKKAIAVTAALAMSAIPGTGAFSSYAAWETPETIASSSKKLAEWVPTTFEEAMAFSNKYGSSFVNDNLGCLLLKVNNDENAYFDIVYSGSAAADIDDEIVYLAELEYDGKNGDSWAYSAREMNYHYYVVVYDIKPFETLNVRIQSGYKNNDGTKKVYREAEYVFSKLGENGGTILTEEDIFSWLPDCVTEFDNYKKANGEISVHDEYVVFCGNVLYSAGSDVVITQSGSAELELVGEYSPVKDEMMAAVGGADHIIKLYKAKKAGNVDLKVTRTCLNPEQPVESEVVTNIDVNKDLIPRINHADLPEWVPQDFESAMDYDYKYGSTHVEDGLICVAKRVYGKTDKLEIYASCQKPGDRVYDSEELKPVFAKELSAGSDSPYNGFTYIVSVYKPEPSLNVVVDFSNWNMNTAADDRTYAFETDAEGKITEIDKFAWLPDSISEFDAYNKKYGEISVHGKYVVFCGNDLYDSGYKLNIEQDGTGWMKEVYHSAVRELLPPPGSETRCVILYTPVKSGDITMNFEYRPASADDKRDIIDHAEKVFRVDKDYKITEIKKSEKSPLLKGDCNYDGYVGIADVVTLQNWLIGRGWIGNYENADYNSDGKITIFDSIALRREIFSHSDGTSRYISEPEPLMAVVYNNRAWGIAQNMTVYDQNGKAYHMAYSSGKDGGETDMKGLYNDPIYFGDSEGWYDKLCEMMKNDEVYGKSIEGQYYERLNDDLVYMARELSENYSSLKDSEWGDGLGISFDAGGMKVFIFGKEKDEPVCIDICENGDYEAIRNNEDIHRFVNELVNTGLIRFSGNIDYLTTGRINYD